MTEGILRECSAYEIVMLVHELHKRGYEQLRLYAVLSPSGGAWRWFLYPKILMDGDNRYEHNFDWIPYEKLNGSTGDSRPERREPITADQVLREHAAFFEKAKGEDKAYVEWFQQIVDHAERHDFPIAYCEYYSHRGKWVFYSSDEELSFPPF